MITVAEATDILAHHLQDFGIEDVILNHSTGRILRENIHADRDFPPFDRVSMDGIAIRFDTFEKGSKTFFIAGMAAAGSPQLTLSDPDHCFEIMTGSILPLDADTVIPYEWLTIENGNASIIKENVKRGQNVHRQGTDRRKGDLIIPSGRFISPAEIAVLASVGKSTVSVSKLPSVMIISTGNELVEIIQTPLPHQVRMSNVHQLHSCFQKFKIEADTSHLQDDYESIQKSLEKYISTYDVVIISGGISEGKYDFIPAALESLGLQKHFYKVKQRPGKPFWFGTHTTGCTVFAIPGNPVSSFLCYTRYIKPWLQLCLKQQPSLPQLAKLSEDVTFTPDLTYFLTVKLHQNKNGEWIAIPSTGHGSGDLSNLVNTDGFLELPAERIVFKKGEIFIYFRF
ncbi:MAG TPA: molybdopterin molybdotransferase MoeA [Saprospiraceae bacterium]|nr:molybdopterin molybdotransferase MoeA [Saprospiraceae bacterium]